MRATKPSGIEWAEEIPQEWLIKPLFAIGSESRISNSGGKSDNLLSLSFGEIVEKNINSSAGLLPESFDTYQVIKPDDMVFRFTDLQNDKRSLRSALSKHTGIITSAYMAFTPRDCEPRFLAYLMRSYDLKKVFYAMGGGLRQSLKYGDVKRLPIILPPMEEQKSIAEFLDRETAQINNLIAKQEQLIALINERLRGLIVRVATKGLNPTDARQTGLPWLPECPSSWGQTPLYKLGHQTNLKNKSGIENNLLSLSYGRIVRKDIASTDGLLPESFDTYQIVEKGDIIFRFTDLQNDRRSLRSGLAKERGIITSAYVAFRPTAVNPEYLNFLMRAYDLLKVFYGMGSGLRQSLNYDEVRKMPILVPSPQQQLQIVHTLSKETETANELIFKAKAAVGLLKERRQALVSAAVTGEISVGA